MDKAMLPSSPATLAGRALAEWTSRALGWGYVSLWAASFVPQIIHSHRRRDMAGVSSDYLWLNVVAFACYFATTVALLESTIVRREYAERHDGYPPIARWNDAVFAAWAWLCALVQLAQAWMFRSTANRVSRPTLAMLTVMVVTLALGALGPAVTGELSWTWLAFVDYMGILKSYITLIKYVPQVLLNLKRQSTEGYHVANVGSDFLGGILSLLQLFLDAAITGDWSGIAGNPAKLYVCLPFAAESFN